MCRNVGIDCSVLMAHTHTYIMCRNVGIDCSVLMGGNVATEIAKKELSEAVIGATSRETGLLFRKLFQTPYFNVDIVQDVVRGRHLCACVCVVMCVCGYVCVCVCVCVCGYVSVALFQDFIQTLFFNVDIVQDVVRGRCVCVCFCGC